MSNLDKPNNQQNNPKNKSVSDKSSFCPRASASSPRLSASPEEREQKLQKSILNLFEHAKKSNEGQEGIVFSVKKDELPDELIDVLKNEGIQIEDDLASKVLKVYEVRRGKHEFQMLEIAYQAIAELPEEEREKFAHIPRPVYFADIEVNEKMREYFSINNLTVENRVAVIMMDFINGEDLLESILRKVLEVYYFNEKKKIESNLSPDSIVSSEDIALPYDLDSLKDLNFAQLYSLTANHLGFGLFSNEDDDIQKREKMSAEFKKLSVFLQKNNLKLNKKILNQIKLTLTLFKDKKIKHGDLVHNLRNIMVAGDIWGDQEVESFIIDFGRSFIGNQSPDDFPALDDMGVLKEIEIFTTTKEEKERETVFRELEKDAKKRIGSPKYLKRFSFSLGLLSPQIDNQKIIKIIEKEFDRINLEEDVEYFYSFILDVVEKYGQFKDDITSTLSELSKRKDVAVWIINKTLSLLDFLKSTN